MENIRLSTEPEIITSVPALFLYLEKIGPFSKNAPQAWGEFWLPEAGGKIPRDQITGMLALSRIDCTKEGDDKFTYQAGIYVKSQPESLPANLQIRELPAGKYARFLLKGPYEQLAYAYPAAFAIMEKKDMKLREDFCMERYLNDPETTPQDQLETEILIPI
eukprot:TRINITY_DN19129_c0_g1::TRINITY_DN19129_c0_g1_i1::g.13907::m.13907 TRINITY_DN19129_c0_g1::TRINITY_DN19129_c0_g1_i1::g.13907  ORF type:complete len:162 (+),score=27.20,GyrI-like/PF06445.10/3.5e-20,Cass2/PF14526.1/1.9e-11 TRINITY_DN19129_c0_g1_i1:80-565(+)